MTTSRSPLLSPPKSLGKLLTSGLNPVITPNCKNWLNCVRCGYHNLRQMAGHSVVVPLRLSGKTEYCDIFYVTDPPQEWEALLGAAAQGKHGEFLQAFHEAAMEDIRAAGYKDLHYAAGTIIGCPTEIEEADCLGKIAEEIDFLDPAIIVACSVQVETIIRPIAGRTIVRISDVPAYAKLSEKDAESRFSEDVLRLREAITHIWKVRIATRERPKSIRKF